MREEAMLRAADALSELPSDQLEAIILRHWHDWSLKDIGEHLSVSRFTATELIRRGALRLRSLLRGLGDAGRARKTASTKSSPARPELEPGRTK